MASTHARKPLRHGFLIGAVVALFGGVPDAAAQATDGHVQTEERPRNERRRERDPEKVHDPSTIIYDDGVYRCLATGRGVTLLREEAAGRWLPEGRLFDEGALPEWHETLVPGNRGHLWAPDVIKLGERYFVYYSVSTFGRKRSAIGLAVGETLNPASADWKWDDRGPVVESRREDSFNAIDPAIFLDKDGSLWMTFGSFWDGIHLIELDPETGLRKHSEKPPLQLAEAPEIEAPFLHRRDGWYYLFLNWGKCCRGAESTYEIRVGRSREIKGPYVDREGRDLREGGGTLLLETEGRHIGPGHPSLLRREGKEWLAHHYYDGENRGRSRLRLVELRWGEDSWPEMVDSGS